MSLDWLLAPQLVAFGDAGYDVVGLSAPGPHVARLGALGIEHVSVEHFTRSNNPMNDVRAFVELLRQLADSGPTSCIPTTQSRGSSAGSQRA